MRKSRPRSLQPFAKPRAAADFGDGSIVTKKGFARLAGVSPGRVPQWLTEGKIGPEALVGAGRTARINVALAMAQPGARRRVRLSFPRA